jgi:hypothetical protein
MPRPPDLDGAPLDGIGLLGVRELDQTNPSGFTGPACILLDP